MRGTKGDGRSEGFTLVECLLALALLGFALVVAAALLTTVVRSAERLRVHQRLVRVAETTVESVRSGALPPIPGPLPATPAGGDHGRIRSTLDVRPRPARGLYEITVRAEGTVGEETLHFSLTTMVWRP